MKKLTVKQITTTALILAICIGSQFFKNLSVFITGPIINAALIITVVAVGLIPAIILSVILPVTSFFITGSPIMAAVPLIIPFVMLGNITLVLVIWLLNKKIPKRLYISMAVGSVAKAVLMGVSISLIIAPLMLPEKMQAKLPTVQMTFSVVQLATALIGSVFAFLILIPLRKFLRSAEN